MWYSWRRILSGTFFFLKKACIIYSNKLLSDCFPPTFWVQVRWCDIKWKLLTCFFLKRSKPRSIFIPHRTARKEFITAKYVDHKFSRKTCASAAAKLNELLEAVKSRDLLALIQVYAEGVELMEPLLEPGQVSLATKQDWIF